LQSCTRHKSSMLIEGMMARNFSNFVLKRLEHIPLSYKITYLYPSTEKKEDIERKLAMFLTMESTFRETK